MLIICDRQSDNVQHRVIGPYYIIELPIYAAGVRHDPETGYVFRDPDVWLSDHMLGRMVGVPVLLHDPDSETDVPEYPANLVGNVLSARVEDEKCIAEIRIFSQSFVDFLESAEGATIEAELVTVPAEDTETEKDSDTITVEPPPRCVSFVTLRYWR